MVQCFVRSCDGKSMRTYCSSYIRFVQISAVAIASGIPWTARTPPVEKRTFIQEAITATDQASSNSRWTKYFGQTKKYDSCHSFYATRDTPNCRRRLSIGNGTAHKCQIRRRWDCYGYDEGSCSWIYGFDQSCWWSLRAD